MGRLRSDAGLELNAAATGVSFSVSARAAGIVILLIIASGLGCRLLDAEQASTAALTLLTATLIVGVVPGALVTLLWSPRPQLTALEVIGFGIGISFGLVQLLTILAISVHVSAAVILTILVIGSTVMAARVIQRPVGTVVVSVDELIVLSLLIVLGAFLYNLGSPVDWFEDQVHVAIVRRLSELQAPRLDNVYFAPGIVYTYPFPGTHYFMALIARLSDVDALFVYHKLRFFWGPAALVMLHLAARAVFGRPAIACAVTVTAFAFVASGTFAMVPGFRSGWGQLIPYSHASDVAMTVLLPALLVVSFGYLLAVSTRERSFFLTATAMLTLMLTIVHIREIVQFAAYLGCFLVATLAFRAFRPYARRTAALLALVLTIATIYTLWHREVVTQVSDLIGDQRARLVAIATTSSLGELVFAPASKVLGDFVLNAEPMFEGLTPLFLFAGPAVMLLFWRQPLMWLIVPATAAYLLVMSVPLLAIPYIYVTYFEILFTPVRNVIFFVYLFAGALIHATVVALTRIDRTRISPLVIGTLAGALALLVSLCVNRSNVGFFAPLIAAYGLAILLPWGSALTRKLSTGVVVAALLVVVGFVALYPEREPAPRLTTVAVRWTAGLPEQERAALEQRFSLADGEPNSNYSAEVNVWNYALNDPSQNNVRALVTHPAVVDTSDIDRRSFTVIPQSARSDHPYFGVQHVAWLQYPGAVLFLGAAVFVWTLGFIVPAMLATSRGRAAVGSLEAAMSEPFYRRALPYALFMIPFALWSARPTLSPLPPGAQAPGIATPGALIAQLPCVATEQRLAPFSEDILGGERLLLPERTACPPDAAVIEWVDDNVPVDAVFAINRWNPYFPSVYMPQQVVVYPQIEVSFEEEHELFKTYYRFYDERIRKNRVQPFFNSVETPAERAAFVEALSVTHVLVDPAYYEEMRAVLDALPQQFTLKYSNGKWAVYEVLRNSIPAPRAV